MSHLIGIIDQVTQMQNQATKLHGHLTAYLDKAGQVLTIIAKATTYMGKQLDDVI